MRCTLALQQLLSGSAPPEQPRHHRHLGVKARGFELWL